MKVNQITETTAGATSAGSVAGVAQPLGKVQKRTGNLFKGKKTNKKFYESKMKDLAYDIQHLDAGNFMKKYGQSKDYFTKKLGKPPVSEAELSEQDLIVVPGMRKSKDTSFIPHDKDRRDHEVEMARSDLYAAAKDAMRIYKLLKDRTEDQGLMGWQQSYITLATDYLNSVADSLEHDAKVAEMTGGVLVGGMSNFEEDVAENTANQITSTFKDLASGFDDGKLAKAIVYFMQGRYQEGEQFISPTMSGVKPEIRNKIVLQLKSLPKLKQGIDPNTDATSQKYINDQVIPWIKNQLKAGVAEGGYYNPLDQERREQDAMDQERRDFKRREMEYELRNEPQNNYQVSIDGRAWKVFADKAHAEAVARKLNAKLNAKGKKATVHPTGASVSEEQLDEKKDACYNKVKSRYKVWPSAYASGALVKCRKVGASNWGNKSKK